MSELFGTGSQKIILVTGEMLWQISCHHGLSRWGKARNLATIPVEGRVPKPKVSPRSRVPAPPPLDTEKDDSHQLDELA